MPGMNSDIEFSLEELESIFGEDSAEAQPQDQDVDSTQAQGAEKNESVETTKAFAHRLKAKTEEAVAAERERIAKDLGYESYADMQKQKEAKLLEDNGLDAKDVAPVVEKLVEERLKNDPRMKELDGYRERQMQEFAKRELEEIKKLTNGEVTSLEQVPADVIEDWKKTGSLKKSYIALHGEELIVKARATAPKGDTTHLQSPSSAPPAPSETRLLTEEEKRVWRIFNPGMSEEELNKKTVKKE